MYGALRVASRSHILWQIAPLYRDSLRPHQASTHRSAADQAPSLVCALSTRRICEWYLKELLISKWEPFSFRVFRLGKPIEESRRADSNRWPAHYECAVSRCRGLQRFANPA